MSYEPDITDEAFEDLTRIVDALPVERQEAALTAVEDALLRLATNPRLGVRGPLGRPTYFFRFEIGGTQYHWAATFRYSEDETKIVVTQVYRPTM